MAAARSATRTGAVMARARSPDLVEFDAWCTRTELLTDEEAREHPSAIVRHAAEVMRRRWEWEADPLCVLGRLLDRPRAKRWALAAELIERHPHIVVRRPANPTVRDRLVEEIAARGGWPAVHQWLVETIYPLAVLDVVDIVKREQRIFIRLGREWVVDKRGRRVPWRPWKDLPVGTARRWFIQAIGTQADHLLAPRDRAAGVAAAALAPPESVKRTLWALAAAGVALSPREREILRLSADGKSAAEIAAALDMTRGAVKVAKHRLKKRLPVRL